jgi:hypothetical protein
VGGAANQLSFVAEEQKTLRNVATVHGVHAAARGGLGRGTSADRAHRSAHAAAVPWPRQTADAASLHER